MRRMPALLTAALVSLAFAAGDVWRAPQTFPPASGPSELELLAKSGKRAKRGQGLERLEVVVLDRAGRPVPGLGVGVTSRFGKKEDTYRAGATDAAGRLVVASPGATVVALAFGWDGGAKTIRARLERRKKVWALESAAYRRLVDGENEGSCGNLFRLAPAGASGAYRLEFRVPASLLECERVVYGAERKVGEIARVDSIGRRDVNSGDSNMFSAADETKMGFEASAQFDEQFQRIDDPVVVGYVQRVMEKVVAASDAPKMPIHLRVVHTDDVNAFVTAGGHVYVFTGLIAAADNESQLAGVLAHEGSHAIARHVTEGATRGLKAQAGSALGSVALGALLGLEGGEQAMLDQGSALAAGVVTLRYDRRAETEADLLGAQYLWRAGWDPEAIARFFEKLEKQSAGAAGPAWLSTHPPHEKRVESGILWARAFLPAKERYLVDTAEFQSVRARVAKLPRPKAKAAAAGTKSLHQLLVESPTWKGVVEAASGTKEE